MDGQSKPENGAHKLRSTTLDPATLAWVQDQLDQGLEIGIEQADDRRFRANSWSNCGLIRTRHQGDAIATLEQLLQQYPRQYLRLFSVAPKTRQRGGSLVIQQP